MNAAEQRVTVNVYAGASTPAKLTAAFVDALQKVEVKQSLNDKAGFKLTLRLQVDPKQFSELPILKDGTVAPGRRVKIGTDFGSASQVLADGVVERHEVHPDPAGDDVFTYYVYGRDLMTFMDRDEVATEWPGRSSAQIVTEIINKYSQYSLSPNVIAPANDFTPTVQQYVTQQNATDLAFVRYLGRTFNYVFTIRPGASMSAPSIAYWGPPSRDGTTLPSLAVRMGSRTVLSTQFAYNASAAQKEKGGSRTDTDDDQTLAVESSADLGVKKLASASSSDSALARTRLFIMPGMSGTLARALADAGAQRTAQTAVSVTAEIDGFAYMQAVTPGSLLPVRGAGRLHDGVYYVEEVTHVLERGAYKQTIAMTREGLGATIASAV